MRVACVHSQALTRYVCVWAACAAVHTKDAFWKGYAEDASAVARDRLRLGGARLAQVLNSLHAASEAAAAADAAVATV